MLKYPHICTYVLCILCLPSVCLCLPVTHCQSFPQGSFPGVMRGHKWTSNTQLLTTGFISPVLLPLSFSFFLYFSLSLHFSSSVNHWNSNPFPLMVDFWMFGSFQGMTIEITKGLFFLYQHPRSYNSVSRWASLVLYHLPYLKYWRASDWEMFPRMQ